MNFLNLIGRWYCKAFLMLSLPWFMQSALNDWNRRKKEEKKEKKMDPILGGIQMRGTLVLIQSWSDRDSEEVATDGLKINQKKFKFSFLRRKVKRKIFLNFVVETTKGGNCWNEKRRFKFSRSSKRKPPTQSSFHFSRNPKVSKVSSVFFFKIKDLCPTLSHLIWNQPTWRNRTFSWFA